MKKYMIIPILYLILGITASQAMENQQDDIFELERGITKIKMTFQNETSFTQKEDIFELQHGKTKMKMTFQHDQNENKPDEKVQKEMASNPVFSYSLLDPDLQDIRQPGTSCTLSGYAKGFRSQTIPIMLEGTAGFPSGETPVMVVIKGINNAGNAPQLQIWNGSGIQDTGSFHFTSISSIAVTWVPEGKGEGLRLSSSINM